MPKIDLKDRKILYELDNNSRQTASKIAKKVGLHKNVVLYRIKQLQKNGIIKNFYTLIDASKLGYTIYRLYLTFQNITPEREKEIIKYFEQKKNTWWVGTIEGRYDLAVLTWIKDAPQFLEFYEEILRKYDQYFELKIFSIYVQAQHYRYSFLLNDKYDKQDRTKFKTTGGSKKTVEIDPIDKDILKIIASNARMPTIKIAKKLKTTTDVVSYRIKKLQKSGVIQAFKTTIDFEKLGYQDFKADIWLKDHSKKQTIIKYLEQNPNFLMLGKTIGHGDIELNMCAKSLPHFHKMINDVIIKYSDYIKSYKYFNVVDCWIKYSFMPE